MSRDKDFDQWWRGKLAALDEQRPLSIQTNIATLSHELNLAEAALGKIRAIHRPDPTGSRCVHDQWAWPCATFRITHREG